MIGLSEEAAKLGDTYHSHVPHRLGDCFLDPFNEAIEVGRRSGIPAHITHFYRRLSSSGSASDMLDLVKRARDVEGLDVTFDSYPYMYSNTCLFILILVASMCVSAGTAIAPAEWILGVLVLFMCGVLVMLLGVALVAVEVRTSQRALQFEVQRVLGLERVNSVGAKPTLSQRLSGGAK